MAKSMGTSERCTSGAIGAFFTPAVSDFGIFHHTLKKNIAVL